MAKPPTIVIFPGAWHTPNCLYKLQSILRNNFAVFCFALRSAGSAHVNNKSDAAYMRNDVLEPLFNNGHEVVLIVHSWAGIVASEAIPGCHIDTRKAQNRPGGLVGLIFVAGLTETNGPDRTEDKLAAFPAFVKYSIEADLSFVTAGRQVFYNDVDEDEAQQMEALLVQHSLSSSLSDLVIFGYKENSFDHCRGYIRCLQDRVVPVQYQDIMLQRTRVNWSVKTINAGHSPFVSKPHDLARIVAEFVETFTSRSAPFSSA